MGELATDDADQQDYQSKYSEKLIRQAQIDRLTAWIQDKETQTRFDGWTQAGDTIADAFFDQARTTCRRAERGLVALQESGAASSPRTYHVSQSSRRFAVALGGRTRSDQKRLSAKTASTRSTRPAKP
jgi:cob(I)alamin adenosyltransferase